MLLDVLPADRFTSSFGVRSDRSALLAEVRDGLARRQRELPARLLADAAMDPLRERLDALAQRRLQRVESPLVDAALASLGELPAHARLDLRAVGGRLAAGDATPLMRRRPNGAGARLYLALGNVAGGHTTIGTLRMLHTLRGAMTRADTLLLGVDLRTNGRVLEEELHEDLETRTAFHRHALTVLRRELGVDVDPASFDYSAHLDPQARRVDMLLVARQSCHMMFPGGAPTVFRRGDAVRTAVYATFDRSRLTAILAGVGLTVDAWHEASEGEHGVAVVRAVS